MSRGEYRVKCSSCGVSGEKLESIGFTYYEGLVYCLRCYKKVVGTSPSLEVEEE